VNTSHATAAYYGYYNKVEYIHESLDKLWLQDRLYREASDKPSPRSTASGAVGDDSSPLTIEYFRAINSKYDMSAVVNEIATSRSLISGFDDDSSSLLPSSQSPRSKASGHRQPQLVIHPPLFRVSTTTARHSLSFLLKVPGRQYRGTGNHSLP